MDYEVRLVVEKVSVESQEVVKRDTIKVYDMGNCSQQKVELVEKGITHKPR